MKILVIGPFPNPVTGCSLANQVLLRGFSKKDVKVSSINMSTSFSEEIGTFTFGKVFGAISKYLRIYKVLLNDVIYITPGQSFLGVLKYAPFIFLAKLFRKRVVVHIHGNHLWKEFELSGNFKRKILYGILSLADKGIVLSPSLQKNLSPFLCSENIHSVFNFAEDYLHNSHEFKSFDTLNVIYLSNLMMEKGIFDVLHALQNLQKNKIPFKAKIAGAIDRSARVRIENLLKQLGNNVEYLGVVSGGQKQKLLEWGNVFVFPTYYPQEGQPISIIEAMVTANVIIATNHAGIPDLIDNKNAFFVEKQNPDQVSKVLSTFYSNNGEFVNKSNFNKKYSKIFTEDDYIKNILKVTNDE